MKRLLAICLAVVLALALSIAQLPAQPAVANPGVIKVPGDYSSIRDAIEHAKNGDTVLVAAGNYTENIDMKIGVIIQGSGADVTTIDGTGSDSVVYANNLGSGATLDGFTITNGYHEDKGGGIYLQVGSSPTISNCIITGNSAGGYGGGILLHSDCSPTIINCVITGNSADYGGGIFVSGSSPIVTNCTITGNSATDGGGMYNWSSTPTITNSIIYWNTVTGSGPNIYNYSSNPTFSYCNIEGCGSSGEDWDSSLGTDGGNNIDGDPLFVNPDNDDYHLDAGSPCIDAGDNTSVPSWLTTDLEGNPRIVNDVDMGAYEAGAQSNEISIDIKPGSYPNSINPDSKGVIPVAILTTDDFNAASVNATTVLFGKEGNGAEPVHHALEDVDDDGDTDMILHFKIQETGIEAGDTEATLTGKTIDGTDIIGKDSVRIVRPKGKK